jgi:hypothetical protein
MLQMTSESRSMHESLNSRLEKELISTYLKPFDGGGRGAYFLVNENLQMWRLCKEIQRACIISEIIGH